MPATASAQETAPVLPGSGKPAAAGSTQTTPTAPSLTTPSSSPISPPLQNAADTARSDPVADTGGDIVVTAQRRAERLQDVPISIVAVSGTDLQTRNVTNLVDLPRVAPGLNVVPGLRTASVRTIVRGIGTAGSAAVEPSVAIFSDGFYIPRPGAALATFLDLSNVQILRGPQGTLFGRNASAGALSTESALPTPKFGGNLAVEAGTGGRYRIDGDVNVPLSDTLKQRFAGLGQLFDGLYHNLLDGRDVGGYDSYAGRITAEADLTANLTTIVRADYAKLTGDGFNPYQYLDGGFPAGTLDPFRARVAAAGGDIGDLNTFDRTINQVVASSIRDHQFGFSNTARLTTDSDFTIKLLSGYRTWKNAQVTDTPIGFTIKTYDNPTSIKSTNFSNELQIASPEDVLLGGRLSFVAGLYQYHEKFVTTDRYIFYAPICPVLYPTSATNRALCVAGSGSPVGGAFFNQTTNSLAAYVQATFKLTSKLNIVLGGRETQDKKKAFYNFIAYTPLAGLQGVAETDDLRLKQSKPTWRANLNWKPTSDILVFGSVSSGYKSGGFNSLASASVLGPARNFNAETTKNYELGARTNWADGRLTLNATLYRMDVSGFQDRSNQGTIAVVQNVGDLRQQGVEVEASARPVRNLSLNLSVAYLDSKFLSYPRAAQRPGIAGSQDLAGTRNNNSPKWQGTTGVQYTLPVGSSGWHVSARSDLAFFSDANVGQQVNNDPRTVQEGFSLLSARLTVLGPDDRYSIALFGQNLTNAHYCTAIGSQSYAGMFGIQVPGAAALRCAVVGTPRTIGVRASTRF